MTEQDVIMQLANYGDHMRRYELMLPNVYIQHDSEADLFCVRKSGLCDEFEVKTSRADFLNDKKKTIQYRKLEPDEWRKYPYDDSVPWPNMKPKHEALVGGYLPTNYFWYVVKEGIADIDDVPDFSGLIIVSKTKRLNIVKQPKKLHKAKLTTDQKYMIARKATYRFWKLKNELVNIHKPIQPDIEAKNGN